jgi:1-acyl-sn-glycerol-3-phosphate acyltransferase
VRLLALLQYSIAGAATLVLAPPALLFSLLGLRSTAYRSVRVFAWLVHVVTGVRCSVTGSHNVPTTQPYVVISNHCSHLDAPSLIRALPHPLYIVFKTELGRIPLFGATLRKLGFVEVDRSDSEKARQGMSRAVDAIRGDRRILVFAEGTRSPDGRLQSFKKGGFHIAIDAQVPILPVAVNGSRRLFPKGGVAIRPGRLEVAIAPPIPTAGIDKGRLDDLMARTREAIVTARRRDPDFPDADTAVDFNAKA